ncbi:MAG: YabP/YqfC family sporulation protein [Clostridia bacterium]|nr:YabP/YqfC family sporulation protein [Clostridia bacterium]
MSSKRWGKSRLVKRIKNIANDIFSDDTIEIYSGAYALVSGCKKLKEYTKEKIVLSFKNSELMISGNDLEPESLINGQISIQGEIKEVKYIDN